jgi:hypothetical protein
MIIWIIKIIFSKIIIFHFPIFHFLIYINTLLGVSFDDILTISDFYGPPIYLSINFDDFETTLLIYLPYGIKSYDAFNIGIAYGLTTLLFVHLAVFVIIFFNL